MRSYLLDTSVIINYLRGKKQTVELIDKIEGEMCSSFICLAELFEGVYRANNKLEIKDAITNFFKSLSEVYSVDSEIAEYFGKIRSDLKVKGNVIEDIDIFLAATCLAYDLVLVTDNVKHFSRVKNLKIYNDVKEIN